MTQYARPIQDISVNYWTDEGTVDNDGNLYTSVDEVTLDNDDSYILDPGANSICEVKLSPIDDPQVDTGHILHVLFRSVGSGSPERLNIALMQGTTAIEQWTNNTNRSGSYLDFNTTLTLASSITDYTDLRVRLAGNNMAGGEEMRVSQIYLEVPDAPTGTDVSDSHTAYLAGSLDSSDAQPAFLQGQDIASDAQPAYLVGQESAFDSQPAYLAGGESASDSQPTYLAGQDNTLDSQAAFLQGQDTSSDSQPAYLAGQANTSDSQAAYLEGSVAGEITYLGSVLVTQLTNSGSTNITIPAGATACIIGVGWFYNSFTSNIITLDGQTADPIYFDPYQATHNLAALYKVTGFSTGASKAFTWDWEPGTANCTEGAAYILIFLSGANISDLVRDFDKIIYTGSTPQDNTTPIIDSSDTDLLVGFTAAYSATIDMSMSGQTEVVTPGVYNSCQYDAAYVAGSATGKTMTANFRQGTLVAASIKAAAAGTPTSDSQPAYLSGQDSASDSQPAYLIGQDSSLDSQPAYLVGQDNALDSQPAFLQGKDQASGSQPVYLAGGQSASAGQPAYLAGSGNTASDSQAAYLRGQAEGSDSQPVFLQGQETAVDSQPAYLAGQDAAEDNQAAYLAGQAEALGAQTAYLLGGIAASDSQPAYLNASGNPASDAQPAFLQGQDTGSASQPAYLAGQESTIDSQPAFIQGYADTESSQAAYLMGGMAASAVQPAYLEGEALLLLIERIFKRMFEGLFKGMH